MSVLSLDDAKTHLNITTDTDDAELQTFINAAEAAIVSRGVQLGVQSVTERVHGLGPKLIVSTLPLDSVTSITALYGAAVDLTNLTWASSGVIEWVFGGIFISVWYDVTYTAGMSTVPDDLLLADKELVRHLWETQRGAAQRTGSALSDGLAPTLPTSAYTFPMRVTELLAPYMEPGF